MRNRKGTALHRKSDLRLQTDHGVTKRDLLPAGFGALQKGTGKNQTCFQRLQVRHVTTQAVVSEFLPPLSPPSQLTHPSVVSCMNSSCQSHGSLLLQPYQQQI